MGLRHQERIILRTSDVCMCQSSCCFPLKPRHLYYKSTDACIMCTELHKADMKTRPTAGCGVQPNYACMPSCRWTGTVHHVACACTWQVRMETETASPPGAPRSPPRAQSGTPGCSLCTRLPSPCGPAYASGSSHHGDSITWLPAGAAPLACCLKTDPRALPQRTAPARHLHELCQDRSGGTGACAVPLPTLGIAQRDSAVVQTFTICTSFHHIMTIIVPPRALSVPVQPLQLQGGRRIRCQPAVMQACCRQVPERCGLSGHT